MCPRGNAFALSALLSAAFLGALVALRIPAAKADLGPLPFPGPTVTLPPVTLPPITLPVTLPGETTTTAPSPAGGNETPSGTGSSAASPNGSDAVPSGPETNLRGAIKLADGSVSIPVASVTAPLRLVITRVVATPRTVRARGQKLRLAVLVRDSRGYLVRGAHVEARSANPGRLIQLSGPATRVDGTASLLVRTTKLLPLKQAGKLAVVVRAGTPDIAARKQIVLPIRPR